MPDPMDLMFRGCKFEDGGTAFVNALAKRKLSYGSLRLEYPASLDDNNLQRLFQLNVLNYLSLPSLDNNVLQLQAFSAKVNSLDCHLDVSPEGSNYESLEVWTKRLSVNIGSWYGGFPIEPTLAFLQRLAQLGHFVYLKVRFPIESFDEIPDCIAEELIRTVFANKSLQVLDLYTDEDDDVKWDSHFSRLFEGLKDHPALYRLKLAVEKPEAFGPNCIHLERLLIHNRYIGVMDDKERIYIDTPRIERLYRLNCFFCDSIDLEMEPPSIRPSLVATTLMEAASNDFHLSHILLANHADMLCELVHFAIVDSGPDDDGSLLPSNQDRKRRR
ncbi:hypothetical protein FisN_26Hu150 [Fistulifera solaris]|uniref:FBD domain-containing protein n=1 Tax=Fistulifera solaris TaxID=1519565 RepID=A0A1Z5JYF8_FISSO|nr:hypothetical protein FisN_26Hu150 [Fistulifera solaris]|eukprot:GAX18848.1 hypothetical protein FisN_26Hu150 [Fistulifera solaris]